MKKIASQAKNARHHIHEEDVQYLITTLRVSRENILETVKKVHISIKQIADFIRKRNERTGNPLFKQRNIDKIVV